MKTNLAKLEAWKRLNFVIERSKLSINGFAKSIGLARGENLYQIKKGNNGISRDLADRVCRTYPDISRSWLLIGDGEPIVSHQVDKERIILKAVPAIDVLDHEEYWILTKANGRVLFEKAQ